jgi:ribonuclease HI
MPWIRKRFKKNKVYVQVDEHDALLLENGLASIKFQVDDERAYKANPQHITNLDDPLPPEPPGAPQPPRKARSASKTKTKPAAPPPVATDAIIAYTDGACSGNPGPAGAGVVLLYKSHRKELCHYLASATNNIAELMAVKLALLSIKDRSKPVQIHTDSSYVEGVLGKSWKTNANAELIGSIRQIQRSFPHLTFVKVAGHAGVPENERADELARQAIKTRQRHELMNEPIS